MHRCANSDVAYHAMWGYILTWRYIFMPPQAVRRASKMRETDRMSPAVSYWFSRSFCKQFFVGYSRQSLSLTFPDLNKKLQLSQRDCAMLRVIEYFAVGHSKRHPWVGRVYVPFVPFLRHLASSNDVTLKSGLEVQSLKMVPFESFGTVSYSHSIVTMALSGIMSEI